MQCFLSCVHRKIYSKLAQGLSHGLVVVHFFSLKILF